MTLRQIQKDLQAFLLYSQQDIIPAIVATPQLSTELRLGIYGNAYYSRLSECLGENYPALHTLLGDDEFDKLCIRYIDEWPSKHFSVRYFGHQLSQFLQQHPTYSTQGILAEMALWEWRLRDAFDAQDHPSVTPQDLEKISLDQWPNLRFGLHPSFQQLELHWNTVAIWQQIQDQGEPIAAESQPPQTWVIWRKQLNTLFQSMSEQRQQFIEQIYAEQTFQEICEYMAKLYQNQGALIAASNLRQLVEDGIICQIILEED